MCYDNPMKTTSNPSPIEDFKQLEEKRKNYFEALRENDFIDDIRRLLNNIYPDQAHYIYELIQNAEDAQASQVRIDLYTDRVEFAHDGKAFTIDDVNSITAIGHSNKIDDPTTIGKFGVGFKAVFAYTATPQIRSGRFHFRILEMIVPELIGEIDEPKTIFVFPFDAHDKKPEDAFNETYRFLSDLSDHTLLFLRNINRIEYRRHDEDEGITQRMELERVDRPPFIDVQRQTLDGTPSVHHYLRFENDVSVEDDGKMRKCPIAIAFGIEERKIMPIEPGHVCIYFPAIKETSNLRFHLHAPFASTVARASVRDCPANDKLRDHLADLAAQSMHKIRDLDLLDVSFLSRLPNSEDSLSGYYQPIMDRLIDEFNDEPLTPTSSGGHAKASTCFRASAGLLDLVSERDLADLLGRDHRLTRWIKNPPQLHQREDRFLSMLDIQIWDVDDLMETLQGNRGLMWLKRRTDEQCQKLLMFLERRPKSGTTPRYRDVPIVRCRDGEFRPGTECYFLRDGDTEDDAFNYVAGGVYSSLKKDDNERAYGVLKEVGVREVGEREQIELILKRRYESDTFRPMVDDMARFVTYFVEAIREEKKNAILLFGRYRIFKTVDEDENGEVIWALPAQVFLDTPYCDTDLKAYYGAVGTEEGGRRALSSVYDNGSIDRQSLLEFAIAVGAETELKHVKQPIPRTHPEWTNLIDEAEGFRPSAYYEDVDFVIPEFDFLLSDPSEKKSRLIWLTMREIPEMALEANFRWNRSYPHRVAASSLVHDLRNASWVPQRTNGDIRYVIPAEASSDLLPQGFLFEPGAKWLQAIQFGDKAQSGDKTDRSPRDRDHSAQEAGFRSADDADKAKRLYEFAEERGVPVEDVEDLIRQRASAANTRSRSTEFPQKESRDPGRRRERIRREYDRAPPKEAYRTENEIPRRPMSKEILREWYTDDRQVMVCQICNNDMPFRKRDGLHYFEAVEMLAGDRLPREHESQYLALCPTCAAKYTEFVKRDHEEMDKLVRALMEANGLEISVRLDSTDADARVRFVEVHLIDVQGILESIRRGSQDGE